MSLAAHSPLRAALFGCALLAFVCFSAALPSAPEAKPGPSTSGHAGISIINGDSTSIRKWPWQVAIADRFNPRKPESARDRSFCGGAVIAPKLVVTAGHCVFDMSDQQIRNLEVISGRSRLNSNGGQVSRVTSLEMPLDARGQRRFRNVDGTADWDVALLSLSKPLSARAIKLAGPDERASWSPGQIVWTTGWGVANPRSDFSPNQLKSARLVMMPDRLCRRTEGNIYRPNTMNCLGGPAGNASTCVGDSGGPLVARTSRGFRLVGLTSFGDLDCRPTTPSVDSRVSGKAMRTWIAAKSSELAGINVIGSGGTSPSPRRWCEIPDVFQKTIDQAQNVLRSSNCRLGPVKTDPWSVGRRGLIVGANRTPGWLAPPGFRLKVWIPR